MITDTAPRRTTMDTVDTTILVAYDGSTGARAALAWALTEGARRRRPLRLVYVLDAECPLPPVRARWPHRDRRIEAEARLARVAVEANAWGRAGMNVTTEVLEGSPAAVLRELSAGAGMIVVGDRGHGGFSGLEVGSVALTLATYARCSVVIVRGPVRVPDRRPVVVGVNGPGQEDVMAAAFAEAALRGVHLVALRGMGTGDDPAHEAALVRDAIHDWRPRFPAVAVTESVVPTTASHALLVASHDAQLVVVGARGSGGFEGLALGATSEAIVHHGLSSVMVVRGWSPQRGTSGPARDTGPGRA